MEGLLLTQSSAPIVGQISWLLGHLMNGIFSVLSNDSILKILVFVSLFLQSLFTHCCCR